MARDRLGSEYSENMSEATTCSCMTSSVDKCSLRSCSMLQEPFFLHPPGTRPRDGIYINPMSAFIEPQKSRDTESFYLHSPNDLVYTRITQIFGDNQKSRNGERNVIPRKDETLTVKVDVHINNGTYKPINNGNSIRSDSIIKDSSEHAYEQICLRQEENDSVSSSSQKKLSDNNSDGSRSRKTDRRYSRSSSASECSNMSSEIHCFSSTTSTPSLSRNSSNECISKSPKITDILSERKSSISSKVENEKGIKAVSTGTNGLRPPPPPPPPPPPDIEEVFVIQTKILECNNRQEKKDFSDLNGLDKSETSSLSSAANKSDASCDQAEVSPASSSVETEEIKTSQVSHLVNKHMVLPFIPPTFSNAADSNTLLKPSEYLKSICKIPQKKSLAKARSVDNLDIQGRSSDEEEQKTEEDSSPPPSPPGPPPPPAFPSSPSQKVPEGQSPTESSKIPQPLATISIQDLTSVQLKRTNIKMNATKTFSAPPPRSVSMTNVSEPFFVQKTDLIAELKKTKDIPGIKKLKVERAQVEKTHEQNLITEISKAFSVTNFVDQIPEKDSAGNLIPIWKRQMLARKAAEKAKKELEEQIARENEERRQKAIPPWKRQLLAKKDTEEKKVNHQPQPTAATVSTLKIEITPASNRDSTSTLQLKPKEVKIEKVEKVEKKVETNYDSDEGQIIPWRAQLRKTNSKLNILD
ncbi:espin isoform X2 [Belonocnema kinseyi]|uniref:espin isoform X2 n=1 Tax=Belonocnema kinseyi TaxID=2817044 RepID=UPI00143E031F|nr:espin isoform X2 [Belonocnema kinseyi]